MMSEKLFGESQRFARPWLTISLFFFEFSLIGLITLAIYQNRIPGLGSLIMSFALSLIPMIFLVLSYITLLEVEITPQHIYFKWCPFQASFRKIDLKEVKKIDIISYKFIGYGYRISTRYGACHVVKGNKGLQIEMASGKKYLIGTQKEEQLKNIIKRIHG